MYQFLSNLNIKAALGEVINSSFVNLPMMKSKSLPIKFYLILLTKVTTYLRFFKKNIITEKMIINLKYIRDCIVLQEVMQYLTVAFLRRKYQDF